MRFTLKSVVDHFRECWGSLAVLYAVHSFIICFIKKIKESMQLAWPLYAVRFFVWSSVILCWMKLTRRFECRKKPSVTKMFSCVSEFSRLHQHLQCLRSLNVVHFWEWCRSLAPNMISVKILAKQQDSNVVHFDICHGSLALVYAVHFRS